MVIDRNNESKSPAHQCSSNSIYNLSPSYNIWSLIQQKSVDLPFTIWCWMPSNFSLKNPHARSRHDALKFELVYYNSEKVQINHLKLCDVCEMVMLNYWYEDGIVSLVIHNYFYGAFIFVIQCSTGIRMRYINHHLVVLEWFHKSHNLWMSFSNHFRLILPYLTEKTQIPRVLRASVTS